jgi:hypothetical protein
VGTPVRVRKIWKLAIHAQVCVFIKSFSFCNKGFVLYDVGNVFLFFYLFLEIKIFIYYVGLDFGNEEDFDSLPDLSQNSFLEMKSSEETSVGLRHQIMLDARKANGGRKGRSDGGKVAKGCKETSNGGKTGKGRKEIGYGGKTGRGRKESSDGGKIGNGRKVVSDGDEIGKGDTGRTINGDVNVSGVILNSFLFSDFFVFFHDLYV